MISPGPFPDDQDVSALKAWSCVEIKCRRDAIEATCFP